MNKWKIIFIFGIHIIYGYSHDIVPNFPIYYTNSSNMNCQKDSLQLEKGLEKEVLWAMKMWDSSVKSGVGIVSGTLLQYGDYDECLAVKEPIKAKYCLLTVTLLKPSNYNSTDPFTIDFSPYVPVWEALNDRGIVSKQKSNVINWAICVPSKCTDYDILESLNELVLSSNVNTSLSLSLSNEACSEVDDNRFTVADITFCTLTGIYGIGVVLITIYDIKCFEKIEERPSRNFLFFSLRRSVNALKKQNSPINGYKLDMLSGIYLITMVMVVSGHQFGLLQVGGILNYVFVEKVFKFCEYSMFASSFGLVVNSFFTLSGFMLGVMLPFNYEKYKPNAFMVVVNRFIRLAPSLLVVVWFYATVFDKTGDGPIWNAVLHSEKKLCVDNWWTSLLFIGNYVNSERFCMVHTWYLFCEFQLFVVTVLTFYLSRKYPSLIKFLISLLIIICIAVSFYATYAWKLTAISLFYKRLWDDIHGYDYFSNFYIKTHFRGAAYLIGFIAGYTFYSKKPKKLSKGETNLLLLGGALILFFTYTPGCFFTDPAEFHLGFTSAIYAILSNVFWAIGIVMITVSLLIGTENHISKIFSWSFLVPLNKLTYNVYIVHMIFQIHSAASRRTPVHLTITEWVSNSVSNLVFSFFAAFLLNIAVELPFRNFFKQVLFIKEDTREKFPVKEISSPV